MYQVEFYIRCDNQSYKTSCIPGLIVPGINTQNPITILFLVPDVTILDYK